MLATGAELLREPGAHLSRRCWPAPPGYAHSCLDGTGSSRLCSQDTLFRALLMESLVKQVPIERRSNRMLKREKCSEWPRPLPFWWPDKGHECHPSLGVPGNPSRGRTPSGRPCERQGSPFTGRPQDPRGGLPGGQGHSPCCEGSGRRLSVPSACSKPRGSQGPPLWQPWLDTQSPPPRPPSSLHLLFPL